MFLSWTSRWGGAEAETVEHVEHGVVPVEGVEVQAGGIAVEHLGGESRGVRDAEFGLRLGVGLDLEVDREFGRRLDAGELGDARQARRRGDRHDAGQDRDRHPGRTGALDESEVVVGVPEQLGDREVRTGDLLGQQRIDVLARWRGSADVPSGRPRPRRARAAAARGSAWRRARPGTPTWRERLALLLHPVDELHQLGRAAEVADARIGVGTRRAGRRAARGSS